MLKFAVIGRNFIVDWFLSAASEFPELKLHGVYSRTKETALEYAEKNGAEVTYTTIDEICADKEVDMVYIASPNLFHEEQAIAILNAKKHVFCEKPVTLSASGLDKILETAKQNNCVFMEGMVPLHMPAFSKIRELLPKLGTIRNASFSFCQYSSRYDKFKDGIMTNAFDPTFGNGAFMDLGIYCVHFMLALFGYPETVDGHACFLPKSIDASGVVVAGYKNKTAQIIFSKVSDSAIPSQIQGEKGCLLIDSVSRPKKLTLVLKNQEPVIIDTTTTRHEMSYELEDFIAQIDGKDMPEYNEISRMGMKLCDTAREKLGIDFKIK